MNMGKNIGKAILGYGAASTAMGLMLYGTGRLLSHLFRDVDPDRIEQKPDDPDRIEQKPDDETGLPGIGECTEEPR